MVSGPVAAAPLWSASQVPFLMVKPGRRMFTMVAERQGQRWGTKI
jgi:hypothetical protein